MLSSNDILNSSILNRSLNINLISSLNTSNSNKNKNLYN